MSTCSDFKGATCSVSCNPAGPCSCSLSTAQPDEHAVHLGGPVYLVSTHFTLVSPLQFLADSRHAAYVRVSMSKTSHDIVQCQTNAPHSQTAHSELPASQAHMQSAPTLIGQPPPGFAAPLAPPASPPGEALHEYAEASSDLRLVRIFQTSFTAASVNAWQNSWKPVAAFVTSITSYAVLPIHKHSVSGKQKTGIKSSIFAAGKPIPPIAGSDPCYCTAPGYDGTGGGTYACFDLNGNACSSSSMPSGSCTLTTAYNRKFGIKWGGPVYKVSSLPPPCLCKTGSRGTSSQAV